MKATCESMDSKPRDATKLSFFFTTRSTATPISTSGAISNILLIAEYIEASVTLTFQAFK